jgi:drug/metabolite transporter (DMT)-like permease
MTPDPPRGSRVAAWACLFAVYIVWGTTYLAIRIVVREMPPFAAAALRFGIAGVVLGLLALAFERASGWPTRRQWRDYGLAGLLFLAGGNAGVMWAETRVSSGIAALMVATTPLWLTFLDGLRRGGQKWTVRVWLGVLLGLAGAGLILESTLAGESLTAIPQASHSAWLGLGYLIVFGAIVGFTAFAYAIHELPASTVGTYAYVNPVVAVFLGRLLLDEPLSPGTLAGAALIVVAVVVTTRARSV